ncbi:hypothetical protein AGMMS49944_02810 [Spirochaetia bacterium]|nr:hypothetical protein AGMMS49944_02810 [Spirochaetia bacterium]
MIDVQRGGIVRDGPVERAPVMVGKTAIVIGVRIIRPDSQYLGIIRYGRVIIAPGSIPIPPVEINQGITGSGVGYRRIRNGINWRRGG